MRVQRTLSLLSGKLVNLVAPDTIRMSALNTNPKANLFQRTENVNAALRGAKQIIHVTNIGAQDVIEGRQEFVISCSLHRDVDIGT